MPRIYNKTKSRQQIKILEQLWYLETADVGAEFSPVFNDIPTQAQEIIAVRYIVMTRLALLSLISQQFLDEREQTLIFHSGPSKIYVPKL